MEIIIRGTPEECKKAIKELAEKDREYVPVYPTYPYQYPNWWYYNWTCDDWSYKPTTTGSITSTSSTYSATSISADDIKDEGSSIIAKVIDDIFAAHNDATSGCSAKSVSTK